ncbi:unnamed protein product, partial [Clonostachys byssicola]
MCSSMPLTLVIVAVVFARHTLADPGDDFSNNLFSDLAPILALFGERVTMQFMSESLGIADCIILAMAPVGIITIIVGAIRVGGPQWLKAIIGRARENLSEAEKEIMSSTSQEVCELYNGHQDDVPNIEVLTFKEAVERKLLVDGKDKMGWREFYRSLKEFAHRWRRFYQNTKTNARRFRDRVSRKNKEKSPGQDSPDLEAPNEDAFTQSQPTPPLQPSEQPKVGWDIKVIRDVTPDAPNLSLNRHDQISRVGVHIVAAFATALQSGVLIFFGFITYSPRLQPNFRKGDQAVAGYACPMAAGGTVFLVLGLFICACIVENKTEEKHWRPSDNATMQVTWLQQAQTVGDQVFKAFATYPKTPRIVFSTSRKSVSSQHETLSTFGVGFALVGFVSQFIGLRGMNWAASVAQLVAALIMVAARAWLRRGLAQPLVAKELTSQFELDWLAMTLANVEDHAGPWRITEQTVENNAIETIEVDRGRIVGYGLRREIIHDDENYRKDTHFESEKMKTNVDVLDFSAEDERLRLKESYRAPYDSRFRYTWHLNQDEEGKEEESKIFLAIKTFDGIIKLYAKDLLYAFISSVAKSLATSIQGNTETRPMEKYAIKNWKSIMLWNRNVARLAQEVQNNIFGTSFEAYLSVLAPLSMEGKLPEPEAVFDIALEKASQDRRDRGLLKAADAHLWLWMQVKRFSCAEGQVFTRGLAYLVEYINDVHEQGRLSKEDNNWTLQDTLYKLEEKMIKEIAATTASQKALARLARLYKDQGRPWAEDLTKRMNLPASNHNSIEALGGLGMTETHQMLLNGADDEWPYLVAEKPSMNRKDVSGWTPLHYLMAKGKKDLLRSLSPGWNPDALDILDINAKDWRGWTPLHYACLHGHFSAIYWFADLPQANLSAQGTDGVTPLHCAAKNGHVYVAEKLIWTLDRKHLVVFGGDADMHPRTLRDYDNGRAAIHWAVVAGHEKMTQLLEADSNLKDRKGWTALHLAIVHGKTDICKLLMRRGSLEALDDRGRTPLLLATEYERWEIAQELVKLEADVNARGPFGWTPLHWVAHARTDANLGLGELLLNKGARVDVANRDGMTPFHLGSESGKLKFLE